MDDPNTVVTGGNTDYYLIAVADPKRINAPYVVEVEDMIEALGMTFAEGNVLKALVRHAQNRRGGGKKGSTCRYEAEKIIYYGQRLLAQSDRQQLDEAKSLRKVEAELIAAVKERDA